MFGFNLGESYNDHREVKIDKKSPGQLITLYSARGVSYDQFLYDGLNWLNE